MAVGCLACAASFFVGLAGATTLLTAVGFGAALFGLYRPTVGLYGIGMLCTVDAMTRVFLASDGGLFRWNTFNYLLLGVAVLHAPFLLGFRNAQLRLLQALTCLTAAGLLLSQDVTRGSYDLLALCSVFGLLIYFLKASASDEAWRGLALVTGSLGALMGLAFFRSAATGILMDPNAWWPSRSVGCSASASGSARSARTYPGGAGAPGGDQHFVGIPERQPRGSPHLAHRTALPAPHGQGTSPARRGAWRGGHHRAGHLLGIRGVAGPGSPPDQQDLLDPNETMEHRTSRRSDLLLGGLYIFAQHPLMGVWHRQLRAGVGGAERYPGDGRLPGSDGQDRSQRLDQGAGRERSAGGLLFGAFVASFAILGWRSRQREPRILGFFATVTLATVFATQEFQKH